MSTYNTNNALGSTSPKDLYDNAENLDQVINSTEQVWVDRLGVSRPTLKAIEGAYPALLEELEEMRDLHGQLDTAVSSASTSATNASASANSASTSATNASTRATNASASANSASTSATNAKASETNAASSASSANSARDSAKTSATTATTKASEAATSATNAKASETNAASSASTAIGARNAANVSANNSRTSEVASKTSETNAASSALQASVSALQASGSANDSAASASASFNSAKDSLDYSLGAKDSEASAKSSEEAASLSATKALNSENLAATSSQTAIRARDDAIDSSKLAKDWAIKVGGTVDGEGYSSKHYAQLAEQVVARGTVVSSIDTPTTHIEGIGSSVNPLQVNVKVSATDGNSLTIEEDGLYATEREYTAGGGITLDGTVFSVPISTSGAGTFVQSLTQTATGIQANLGTPPNTTYSSLSASQVIAGTDTISRLVSGLNLKLAVDTHGLKVGTTSTSAKAGDYVPRWSEITGKPTNLVVNTTQVVAGTGLTGGGTLAADRTFNVSYGTVAGTAAQGNDSRITGAIQKSANLSDLSNASVARDNLGLGSAATRAVGYYSGNLIAQGDPCIINPSGRGYAALDSTPNSANAWNSSTSLQLAIRNSNNMLAILVSSIVNDRNASIQVGHSEPEFANALGGLNLNPLGGEVTVNRQEVFHRGNTTVDGNGFVKIASPIVKLFSDFIEKTEHLEIAETELERLGVGHYVLHNVPPLSKDGWYIETPKDRNNNIYFYLDYVANETDKTLTIKTYEPDYSTGRATAGEPVNILEGRFVSLRFSEDPSLYESDGPKEEDK